MDRIEKVIWTEDGLTSLQEIVEYIRRDSSYYAKGFARSMFSAIDRLMLFPLSGKVVPEYNDSNLREILFQNYRIIYKVDSPVVYIALVIHGSRDFPSDFKINSED